MPRRNETSEEDLDIRCPQCRGTGAIPDLMDPSQVLPCSMCRGLGRVRAPRRNRKRS